MIAEGLCDVLLAALGVLFAAVATAVYSAVNLITAVKLKSDTRI